MKALRLAFAEFASKDVDRMVTYYTETMGYRQTEKDEYGSVYLSNGLDHHNIVITPSNFDGIHRYGYQLNGAKTLQAVKTELQKQGIQSELRQDAKPGISEFLELNDPDGNIIQVFNAMNQTAIGFGKTGIIPLKLGHIAFYSKNINKTVQFYQEALGFWFTDKIGADFANFLTCNSDHHTINILSSNVSKLHHIAFQLKDASHQYASSDLLSKQGYPVIWGPTRHTAGHNIATYHFDPGHNVVELFIDMDVFIPELGIYEPRPWHEELPLKPRVWEGLSAWGTEFDFDLANVHKIGLDIGS
jgi:catechol 2,3-dioxygenase-like lactoylglutathione lyase family enzyme